MNLRTDYKHSRRPCATPGCSHETQTDDPRCHLCREGRHAHLGGARLPDPITEPCAAPRCDRPARALGYCDSHYRQFRAHGRVGVLQAYRRATLPALEAA